MKLFAGLWPVCRKEFVHILRDPGTLFFALILPVIQLLFFGFAIDTNIRQIPTAVLDQAGTQESRRIVETFVNSDAFRIDRYVNSPDVLYELIRGGEVRIGLQIPFDFSRHLQNKQPASILVLVDGSDSQVTSYAINVSNGLLLQEALRRTLRSSGGQLAVEARHAILYNPGTRSPNFFVPGMIAIVLQAMIIMLVAFSVVRERERGTLEQLSLTPVAPLGLMVGKMLPYGLLGFAELCTILAIMRLVFQVPINGSLPLLLLLSLPFLLTALGVGLLISTRARTQSEAFQMAMGTLLPSVFLSGYIFLIENMPVVFQIVSRVVPATYYIAILRGVILRGAGMEHLWLPGLTLLIMGCLAVTAAAVQFVRRRG